MNLGKQPPMTWDNHGFATWARLDAEADALRKRRRIATRLAEVQAETDWAFNPRYSRRDIERAQAKAKQIMKDLVAP